MSVKSPAYSAEEIGRIGEEIYRRDIRPTVMPKDKGKFLALDIESGDYEVGDIDLDTVHRLQGRRPNGVLYGVRVGYTTAYKLGGAMIEEPAE